MEDLQMPPQSINASDDEDLVVPPGKVSESMRQALDQMIEATTCSMCNKVMTKPASTVCGHCYCYDCLHEVRELWREARGRMTGNK